MQKLSSQAKLSYKILWMEQQERRYNNNISRLYYIYNPYKTIEGEYGSHETIDMAIILIILIIISHQGGM